MLTGSVTSGQIITRTGRYRIFPTAGTLLIAIALLLLSTMSPQTPAVTMGVYFLLLGLGLGMVMQVLVLIVQNAVGYADLGVATSGATFFRSTGGAFGVAVFGSVFAARLATDLTVALRGVTLPPGFKPTAAQADPTVLQRLPPDVRAGLLGAYSDAVTTVFLWASRWPSSPSCCPCGCARSRCADRPAPPTTARASAAPPPSAPPPPRPGARPERPPPPATSAPVSCTAGPPPSPASTCHRAACGRCA
ncbi:hypothetical protein P3X83_33915 [Spongiactinospora sp. TRM90649]|nr:hypothetical protein [Spongiactinospora sp. TRM90649]MDF5757615.1 hypothetical protein [Spongiactinospora sp. TRM90649]